jgi:hypothetical protein
MLNFIDKIVFDRPGLGICIFLAGLWVIGAALSFVG